MLCHSAKSLQCELKEIGRAEKDMLNLFRKQAVPGENPEQPTMDISYESAKSRISDNRYNHIAWLMTGADAATEENGRVSLSQQQHEQVLNIAQDITAAVA